MGKLIHTQNHTAERGQSQPGPRHGGSGNSPGMEAEDVSAVTDTCFSSKK